MLSQRRSVSYLLPISIQRLLCFLVIKKTSHAPKLIAFLKRLFRNAGQKAYRILAYLHVHKTRNVRALVKAHAHQIAHFYFPPNSPDPKTGEYLNGDFKGQVAWRAPAKDRDTLERTAPSRLRSLQGRPAAVKGFFHHPRDSHAG
jgi:hypothetical protein